MLGHGGVHETEGESTSVFMVIDEVSMGVYETRGEYASVFMGIDEGAYVSIDTTPLVSFAREEALEKSLESHWRKKRHILRL